MAERPEKSPAFGPEFSIESADLGAGVHVVTLTGEVDLHTAPQLRDRLGSVADEDPTTIVVDLSDVTFIDSMTLGVLLGTTKRLRPRGSELRIVVTDTGVRKIFEITLLDRVLPIFESRASALEDIAVERDELS